MKTPNTNNIQPRESAQTEAQHIYPKKWGIISTTEEDRLTHALTWFIHRNEIKAAKHKEAQIKETVDYNLRVSILEIAESIGCIDAAVEFLCDYSNGLSELKYYHKALAEMYYSQSKQVA